MPTACAPSTSLSRSSPIITACAGAHGSSSSSAEHLRSRLSRHLGLPAGGVFQRRDEGPCIQAQAFGRAEVAVARDCDQLRAGLVEQHAHRGFIAA
jgi:hypothetical protein